MFCLFMFHWSSLDCSLAKNVNIKSPASWSTVGPLPVAPVPSSAITGINEDPNPLTRQIPYKKKEKEKS